MILFTHLVNKIDWLLRFYFGLEKEEIKPQSIEIINNDIVIYNTNSFKRHLLMQGWENFSESDLKRTSPENKEKLGIAAGKSIAKNLVISFEEAQLTEL